MAPTRTVHWGSFIAVHCPNLCIVVHWNDQGLPVEYRMFPELPHDCWLAAFEDIYDAAWKGACHGWVDEVGWGGWGWGAYLGYLEHCTVLAVTRYVAKSVFQDAEWGHPVCCMGFIYSRTRGGVETVIHPSIDG